MSEIVPCPRSRRRAGSSSVLPDFAPRAHGQAMVARVVTRARWRAQRTLPAMIRWARKGKAIPDPSWAGPDGRASETPVAEGLRIFEQCPAQSLDNVPSEIGSAASHA